MVSVENFSQILQIAWDIDISKNSSMVDLYIHDIGYFALQQTSSTIIPMQRQ